MNWEMQNQVSMRTSRAIEEAIVGVGERRGSENQTAADRGRGRYSRSDDFHGQRISSQRLQMYALSWSGTSVEVGIRVD